MPKQTATKKQTANQKFIETFFQRFQMFQTDSACFVFSPKTFPKINLTFI